LFASLLPPGLLAQSDEGPNSRDHLYSVRRTFFGFLYQVLNPDCPCREVVRQFQSLFALVSRRKISARTGAYCIARGRLPLYILARLRGAVAAHASQAEEFWKTLRVRVLDGTTLSMPDTPENQRAYPQSAEQKPGCGFPFMKIAGIFSLSTGVLLDYAKGHNHQHELKLLHRLLDVFAYVALASHIAANIPRLKTKNDYLKKLTAQSTGAAQSRSAGALRFVRCD
jgi:Transposase DDE domain